MGKKFFACLLILASVLSARAQLQYSLRQYTVLDGLPQSQVNMVLEDKNGYLWIGTHGGGLARFDGREFKVYTTRDGLLSNIVHYLKLDSKQNLWIVHPRGITRFDGVSFKAFKPGGSPSALRRIRRVFELSDSIFFVTSQGLVGKIHDDSIFYWNEPVRKEKIIQYTHLLPNRDILLYLNDSSFLLRSPKGDRVVKHNEHFSYLSNIFNMADKTWLSTNKGFFEFDYLNATFTAGKMIIDRPVLQYDPVTKAFWTRHDDRLLKEYWQDGIHKVDTVLKEVGITQVFLDSEGNTWFGSSGNGLYKYFVQDFDRCTSDKLNSVFAINEDRHGSTWIGSSSKGLWRMDKSGIKSYKINNSMDEGVSSIEINPAGEVWVGTSSSLGRYNADKDEFKWFTRIDGLPGPGVSQINFDATGKIWFSTNGGGVGYYDGTKFSSISIDQGLPSRIVLSLRYMPFNDVIYAGTDLGLSVIKDFKATSLQLKEIENTGVFSLSVFRKKYLLVGSGGAGVLIYNVETGAKKMLDTTVGLPSDFIYFVAPDLEDLIWIGTEKGISRVKLSEGLEIDELLHFGYDNGLAGVETNPNAYYLGKDKYFGMIDGVYAYNDLRNAGWHSFGLHLTDVELFNGQYPIREYGEAGDGFFQIPKKPGLPSDRNYITFHFNRVDKRYPKSVRYQYILQNYDKTWSLPSSNNQVTYGNLPPGDYVFIVKATNNSGSWDTKPLSYAFTINAPFYRTTAFQVLAVVLAIGGVALYFYIRVRRRFSKMVELQKIRQQEQDSLRKEIARDFHDEMGNQLTRIINYISLMKLSKNGHSAELYNKVEDSAKYLYTGTRDFIWSIDPVNDELSKLFIHIRDFGEKLFNEKDINFRAYNEVKGNVIVPYGFSREANLIFKEAMTNSFNHSQARNVSFTLKQEGDQFEMILEDDGKGFVTEELSKVNGVKNMKSRADRIHSYLQVRSAHSQGTTIRLIFTINKKRVKYGIPI
ncbi:MAG TPA: two-component regulator propeller domain-containing protein [Cyclobacteriaceae bacterium]|nr:two-component regulator propeller domain-containing protein [Cyclobacteriaceae bacterium]